GCGEQASRTNEVNQANQLTVIEDRNMVVEPAGQARPVKQAKLSKADLVRVCRAAHGSAVGRSPTDMKASAKDDVVRLSYVRDDGKAFAYDCIVENNLVRTRMIDEAGPGTGPGEWSGRGSTTAFELLDGAVHVTTTFSDGSKDDQVVNI
ncbi:hypothetical protein U1708_20070, partial [Sphingomonas sp. ZB1N12]|uniref:hypothetical protein n=1 Tax=Sphingomonas arabinosi TaxID=3096160 RepID=UPI002FCC919A